jgi:hypothetical protein
MACEMKNRRIIAISAFFFARSLAIAIPIQVDLGSQGVFTFPQSISFPEPAVQFQGQNVQFDFTFQNDEFIRLFTATQFFDIDVLLRINNAPSPLIFTGSEYLTDSGGVALGPPVSIEAFPVTNGVNEVIGTDFFAFPSIGITRPVDIYGIHLSLNLPNELFSGFEFPGGTSGAITFDSDIYGIGPNIPADIVPEASTMWLFALGVTALVCGRRKLLIKQTRVPAKPSPAFLSVRYGR